MAQDWKTPRREPACRACGRAFADGEAHFSTLAILAGELLREDLCRPCWAQRDADPGAEASAAAGAPDHADQVAAAPATGETGEAPAELDAGAAEGATNATDAGGSDDGPTDGADASASEGPVAEGADAARERPQVLVWWRTRHVAERKRKLALDVDLLEQLFRSLAEREEQNLQELRYLLCLLLMRKRRLKVARVLRAGEEGAESESFLCRRPRTGEEFRVAVFDFTPERTEELRDELRNLLDGVDPDELEAASEARAEAAADEEHGADGPASGAEEPAAEGDPDPASPPDPAGDPAVPSARA